LESGEDLSVVRSYAISMGKLQGFGGAVRLLFS